MDGDSNDFANGFSSVVTRDGQGPSATKVVVNAVGATPYAGAFDSASAYLHLNKAGTGHSSVITGLSMGQPRWHIALGDTTAEGGATSGSNFAVARYNDAGGLINSPLFINRASGLALFGGAVQVTAPGALNMNGGPSTNRVLQGLTNNILRWQIYLGNAVAKSGSSVGSDFAILNYTDAGGSIATPLSIKRNTSVTTFSVAIVNGPSDRSLKENIAPLVGSLDKVMALKGVSFNFIKDADKRRQIGLVAQDVAPIVPEVLQDFIQPNEKPKLAIDYTRLVALVIEALKELASRVETLEGTRP